MRKLTLIAALVAATFAVAGPASADRDGRYQYNTREAERVGDTHQRSYDRVDSAERYRHRERSRHSTRTWRHNDRGWHRPFVHRHHHRRHFAHRHFRPVLPIYRMRGIVHHHHPYGVIRYLAYDNGYYRAHVRNRYGNFFALILDPYSGAIVARFALR